MAYGGAPNTDNTDAVRLLIWDISTSTASELLSDTEVDWFISISPNIYAAACLAANVLSARVTTLSASTSSVEEKKVGDLMLRMGVSAGNVEGFQRAYSALCAKLARQSALQSAPFAGGISRNNKASQVSDSDRVRPAFTRDQFANPSAVEPSGTTGSS